MLTLGNMILVAGSLFLLAFISWATYQSGRLLQESPPDFNLLLSLPENGLRLLLVGACLVLGLLGDVGPARLGWQAPQPLLLLGQGLLLGWAMQWCLSQAVRRAVALLGKDVYSPLVLRNILPKNRQEAVLVALAFIPAVLMEELLFRSLLLGGFSIFFNPWLLAVTLSMLFGFLHLAQGGLAMVATSLVGFVLSGSFLLSGSLLVPFTAHYVINLLQLWDAHVHRDWLEGY